MEVGELKLRGGSNSNVVSKFVAYFVEARDL